jgi:hypothetical protein
VPGVLRALDALVVEPTKAAARGATPAKIGLGKLLVKADGLRCKHGPDLAQGSDIVKGWHGGLAITRSVVLVAAQLPGGSLSDGLPYRFVEADDGCALWFCVLGAQVNVGAMVQPAEKEQSAPVG